MDREQIKLILPHRDDMLLLDEATLEDGVAHGLYHVRGDEFFLRGHFPGNQIVPGVIQCEILAQSACVLIADQCDKDSLAVYAGLDKVRFRSSVFPGDDFRTEVTLTKARHPFYFLEGKGYVGDRLVITASFSIAITKKSDS